MDRDSLRQFTHNAENFLSVSNSTYKQWVFRYTFLELEKDLGTKGDITTNVVFSEKKNVKGKIITNVDGIVAGIEEVKYFLVDAPSNFRPSIKGEFELSLKVKDGDEIKAGDTIMEISADVHDLLMIERIVLNLLMRMSGVATFTRKIVDMVKDYDVLVVPTRKTLWGLLDKKAVVLGGAGTHRLNLGDAVLVKDNHLDLLGRDLDEVLKRISKSKITCRFVEIEVDTGEEALQVAEKFVAALDNNEINCAGAILLDNMSPREITEVLKKIKANGLHDQLLFEASGGINEDNVVNYAKTGVDLISMGCLTMKTEVLDLSLDIC